MTPTPDELKRFALLAEFTDADRRELFELLEPASVLPKRSLFREGSPSDGLALLVEGSVRLESRRTGRHSRVGGGHAIGGLSLVVVGPREATAVTESQCHVLWLKRTSFRRLVEDAPRTACRLLEAVADDVASYIRAELAPR